MMHWTHVLHMLTLGYARVHSTGALLRYYLHHDAIGFLRSGITSESPATRSTAFRLLQYLTARHVAPVDW